MSLHAAPHLNRGLLLLQQRNPSAAEAEFRQHLAGEPQDGFAHAWLAHALVQQERFDEAEQEAQQAIHLAPDQPTSHRALAHVLDQRNRFDEAEQAIREAIRLDPTDPGQFAVLASLHLQRKRWREAVQAADQGLRYDPDDVDCTNIRAVALRNLGDAAGADRTVAKLLQQAPEDATAHANQGWAHLSSGRHKAAMESFREALRLEPGMEWARSGLVTAMKARNPIFRWMLKFFMWSSRLSSRAQWGLILGLYIGFQVFRRVGRANPDLAPYIMPILVAYVVFAFLTWTANPLFNLLLRLDRFGRYALSREETVGANCVGACLLGVIAGLTWWGWAGGEGAGLTLAIVSGLLVIPVSAIFTADAGWPRSAMTAYVAILLLTGLGAVIGMTMTPELAIGGSLFLIFVLGAILSSWVGIALSMVRPTR